LVRIQLTVLTDCCSSVGRALVNKNSYPLYAGEVLIDTYLASTQKYPERYWTPALILKEHGVLVYALTLQIFSLLNRMRAPDTLLMVS